MRDPARYVPAVDGPWSVVFTNPLSIPLTRLLARTSITPTRITLGAFALALAGSFLLLHGTRVAWIAGALVLQFSYILDGVDGTLARATGRTSRFGAWLDRFLDVIADIHIGLAYALGAAAIGGEPLLGTMLIGLLGTNLAHWAAWNITTPMVPGLPPRRRGRFEAALLRRGIRPVFGRDLYLLSILLAAIFFSPALGFWLIVVGRNLGTIHCLMRTL